MLTLGFKGLNKLCELGECFNHCRMGVMQVIRGMIKYKSN